MKSIIQLLIVTLFFTGAYAQDIQKIAIVETDETGEIILVRFNKETKVPVANTLDVLPRMFQLGKELTFIKFKSETDALGFTHDRYRAAYKNIEIDAGGIIVHSTNGHIEYITSTLPNIKKQSDAVSAVTKDNALQNAVRAVGAKKYKWENKEAEAFLKRTTNDPNASFNPTGKLCFIKNRAAGENNYQLVYKCLISAQEPEVDFMVLVDAKNGSILGKRDINPHANTPGTAETKYNGTKTIITDSYSGGYRLRETTRGQGIETYNMNKNTFLLIPQNFTDFSDNDNNWTTAEYNNANFDNVALDVHWAAEMTYDYFMTRHNRNSYNGIGGKISCYVHYSNNYANAGWGRRYNTIIVGDGNANSNPWGDIEVIGHEFGHGLFQYTINGGNEYPIPDGSEEAAMDEGLADIWGACVEQFANTNPAKDPWISGELITIGNPNGVRSLRNPSANSYNINGYSGTYPDTYNGTGYVYGSYDSELGHVNGNVLGFWFYLLSEGGSGINDLNTNYCVNGIGITKAAQIVYYAQANLLPYRCKVSHLPAAVKQAATQLFGANSPEYEQVINSLIAVNLEPKRTYNFSVSGPASMCSSTTYSLAAPPNATVCWSLSNSNYASIAGSACGTSVTLNKIGDGKVTLNATVTICGENFPASIDIAVGNPFPQGTTIASSSSNYYSGALLSSFSFLIPAGQSGNAQFNVVDPLYTGISWTPIQVPSGASWYSSGNSINISVQAPGQPWASNTCVIRFTAQGPCGTHSLDFAATAVNKGTGFRILPNPASVEVTVTTDNENEMAKAGSQALIYGIKITDQYGVVRKTVQYKQGLRMAKLPVADLGAGIYQLSVFDGKVWTGRSLMLQK